MPPCSLNQIRLLSASGLSEPWAPPKMRTGMRFGEFSLADKTAIFAAAQKLQLQQLTWLLWTRRKPEVSHELALVLQMSGLQL